MVGLTVFPLCRCFLSKQKHLRDINVECYSRSIKGLTDNLPVWRVTLKIIVKPDLINKGAPLLIFQCGGFGRITHTHYCKTVPLVKQELLTLPEHLSLPLVKQELLTLPEHLSLPSALSGVHVTRSLVLGTCFVDRCLSFHPFYFGNCVVCPSSICRF